jgi:hypothetical protein
MFFFIGGVQPRTITVDKNPRTCMQCGHPSLLLKRTDHYLSVFFIPLFPVKKGIPFWACTNCGAAHHESGAGTDVPLPAPCCPGCGRPVQTDFRLCPYCGRPLKSS